MPFQIAIDGPVAAGKGTVARLLAERLHALYVDTGAMYRMTGLLCLQNNVSLEDEDAIVTLLSQTKMGMRNPNETEKDGRLISVFLNDEDVSWKIRTPEVSSASSKVAQLKKVRAFLVKKQQEIASDQDVIMEGRDITFKVLPKADLKIFLTASPEVRAKRRHFEMQRRGQDVPFEDVYMELVERDRKDTERTADPLQIVDDAWVLDTSELTIDQVVDVVAKRAEELQSPQQL